MGVGYLYEVKNFDLFIDIIDVLIKVFPSIRVEIIGDGSQRKQLEDKVINLGLQETIFFAGELPYDEALCKISSAKILLHTSISEGFGLVFAEPLATGTQIVSFDVGIAKESTTWKVCRDKDEMIKALTYFIQHEKELAPSYSDLYLIEETLQGYANLFFED